MLRCIETTTGRHWTSSVPGGHDYQVALDGGPCPHSVRRGRRDVPRDRARDRSRRRQPSGELVHTSLVKSLRRILAAFVLALPVLASAQSADKPFNNEQLDQMLAQIALYPDALLSQVLMASTYPDEFQQAAAWSKANPDAKGDDAVKMVESKGWDPSVASLVAFPEVVVTLGEKADYVKNLGDAFLAQPEDVMNSVQRLRAAAQKAGNLEVERANQGHGRSDAAAAAGRDAPSTTTVVQAPPVTQTIIIEPAQPQVVYVPQYNPTVVYGPWWWPSYPPYYYPPPPGYWWSPVGRCRRAGDRLGRRDCRQQRALGRRQLGSRRRRHQRQPLQQHQRQQAHRRRAATGRTGATTPTTARRPTAAARGSARTCRTRRRRPTASSIAARKAEQAVTRVARRRSRRCSSAASDPGSGSARERAQSVDRSQVDRASAQQRAQNVDRALGAAARAERGPRRGAAAGAEHGPRRGAATRPIGLARQRDARCRQLAGTSAAGPGRIEQCIRTACVRRWSACLQLRRWRRRRWWRACGRRRRRRRGARAGGGGGGGRGGGGGGGGRGR